MRPDVQKRRLAMAIAIVACTLALAPVSGAVFMGLHRLPLSVASEEGIWAANIVDDRDVQGALSRLEELAQTGERSLPEFFEKEIGFLAGARDVRSSGAGRVVGYLVDDGSREALESVRRLMSRAGWSEVSLGGEQGATFVKEGGDCTWALVTCTQTVSATAVVYRCVVR